MPIITGPNNKTRLNDTDIQAIKDMIRGSLESHMVTYTSEDEYLQYAPVRANAPKTSRIIAQEFAKTMASLDATIDAAAKGSSSVNAVDLIKQIYSDMGSNILSALNDNDLTEPEMDHALSWLRDLGTKEILHAADRAMLPRDTDEGYEKTVSGFTLPTEPMEGIENIGDYNPNRDRVQVLYEARSGNSGTLAHKVEDSMEQLKSVKPGDEMGRKYYEMQLKESLTGNSGIHAGGEMARIFSAELMAKDKISFGDLYNAFSGLNRAARGNDPLGGKFRGTGIMAGTLNGVGSGIAPEAVYKTMSQIADAMNQIKQTKDEALRKTQALHLAAFAYSMTISEHAFGDANGRTCRLFADTILQTFGLPPHTPDPEMLTVAKTIGGTPIDFKKAADIVYNGVKMSDQLLKAEHERLKQNDKESDRLDMRATQLEDSVRKLAEEAKQRLTALEGMTKKGHHDSGEYKAMRDALKKASELDPTKISMSSVEQALDAIDSTSKEYERTHKGLFKANRGYGADRLKLAKDNQKFVEFRRELLKSYTKEFSKFTIISYLHPGMNGPAAKQANTNQKKVNLAELEQEENKNKKQAAPKKRRNTVAGTNKTKENNRTKDNTKDNQIKPKSMSKDTNMTM